MTTTTFSYNTLAPVKAVRRVRRAYIGLWGFAFERAAARIDILRAKRDDLMVDLVTRGQDVETETKTRFEGAKKVAADFATERAQTVSKFVPDMPFGQSARIAELEAEIEALSAKLANAAKPARRSTPRKKAAPKRAAKAVAKVEPKVEAVVTAQDTIEAVDKYATAYEKVAKYDADADAAIVRKIVDHLGIALQTRDGQLVACSDAAERDIVRNSWLVKALGVSGEIEALDAKVLSVCEAMKADRMKDRVTFYYLLAKQEGKFAAI